MSEAAKEQAVREHGIVKFFQHNFGFINRKNADSIFVHFSNIDMEGFRTLKQGEPVSFEVEMTPKGPRAVRVVPQRLEQAATK